MESLTPASASKTVIDKHRVFGLGGGYCKDYVGRPLHSQILSFSNSPSRRVVVNLMTSLNCRAVLPPISATSHSHSQASETAVDGQDQLSTAQVKFQLHKACEFGDHFLLVGDDPLFGSWDPENAIKMEWSDGHVWTAEVGIPIEKTSQFKFILKQRSGGIIWQPGPDRIFKTWTTTQTITVVEDWENSELQKIFEDGVPGYDEELLPKTDVRSLEEIQQAENSLLGVAENTTFSEDLTLRNSKIGASAVEEGSYPEKESTISMMVAHNIVSDHRRSDSTEGLKDEEAILADPVLVPGLGPSISSISTDGSPLAGKDKNSDLNDSIRSLDSNDQTALESCSSSEAESEELKLLLQEETQSKLFSRQENLKGESEEPSSCLKQESLKVESEDEQKSDIRNEREEKTMMKFSDEIEFNNSYLNEVDSQKDAAIQDSYSVLKNDMHWGRRTLQNLLSSFGLL